MIDPRYRVQTLLNQAKARVAFLSGPPFQADEFPPILELLDEIDAHLRDAMAEPLQEALPSATPSSTTDNSKRDRTPRSPSRSGQ